MNECDGNQLLENMSAHRNELVISFLVEIQPNKQKHSNRVKPMVKNNQLMEKLGNHMQKKSNRLATNASISLALLRRCKKIDDVQYLYTAKEN